MEITTNKIIDRIWIENTERVMLWIQIPFQPKVISY